MTKERLEELIKQGATIWIDDFGEYKLDEKHCEICKINDLRGNFLGRYCFWYEYDYNGEKCHSECELEDIEENVERGKWHWEMDACRTERFEPPTWEDIKNRYCFGFCKNFGKYGEHYILDVNKNCDINWAITVERDSDIIYSGKATKENYEKACEIVRRLFNKEDK